MQEAIRNMTVGASLYEPINVFKPMGPDIGIVDGPFEYLTVGGVRLPLPFTTRMTVVRLSNGDLFLQSPIKFDETLASELQRMGTIRHLVSPKSLISAAPRANSPGSGLRVGCEGQDLMLPGRGQADSLHPEQTCKVTARPWPS